jgi:hypothetical protein
MSNQEKRQQSVRTLTGTAYTYNDDFMAMFTAAGVTSGTFNERLLVWINARLSTAYTTLPDAMKAFAVNQGFTSWNEMGTFSPGVVAALSLPFATSGTLDSRITFSRTSLATQDDGVSLLDATRTLNLSFSAMTPAAFAASGVTFSRASLATYDDGVAV